MVRGAWGQEEVLESEDYKGSGASCALSGGMSPSTCGKATPGPGTGQRCSGQPRSRFASGFLPRLRFPALGVCDSGDLTSGCHCSFLSQFILHF